MIRKNLNPSVILYNEFKFYAIDSEESISALNLSHYSDNALPFDLWQKKHIYDIGSGDWDQDRIYVITSIIQIKRLRQILRVSEGNTIVTRMPLRGSSNEGQSGTYTFMMSSNLRAYTYFWS